MPASSAATIAALTELYADAQRCAETAGLVYVDTEDAGISRIRHGRGFGYRTARGTRIDDAALKQRIVELAIPPAWQKVWICPDQDGHILAIGEDERGRRQYIYHPKWRELRDLLNFYRLSMLADGLPAIRAHVATQLRRRTLDRDRVLATMIRIVDCSGIRIGNEVYAEENQSYGLTTLGRRHVQVHGGTVRFDFPAKSGKRSQFAVQDRAVARVVEQLAARRGRRLFTVDGHALDADDVNALLSDVTGQHVTAKNFRTWRGTLTAFDYLRARLEPTPDKQRDDATVLGAIDAAAESLGNTRTVAREHYVHPHVLTAYTDGTFADYLKRCRPGRSAGLAPDERLLAAFLLQLLEHEYPGG